MTASRAPRFAVSQIPRGRFEELPAAACTSEVMSNAVVGQTMRRIRGYGHTAQWVANVRHRPRIGIKVRPGDKGWSLMSKKSRTGRAREVCSAPFDAGLSAWRCRRPPRAWARKAARELASMPYGDGRGETGWSSRRPVSQSEIAQEA